MRKRNIASVTPNTALQFQGVRFSLQKAKKVFPLNFAEIKVQEMEVYTQLITSGKFITKDPNYFLFIEE